MGLYDGANRRGLRGRTPPAHSPIYGGSFLANRKRLFGFCSRGYPPAVKRPRALAVGAPRRRGCGTRGTGPRGCRARWCRPPTAGRRGGPNRPREPISRRAAPLSAGRTPRTCRPRGQRPPAAPGATPPSSTRPATGSPPSSPAPRPPSSCWASACRPPANRRPFFPRTGGNRTP
jgi:hypothetical protein